jgi:hypothetical protein
VHANIWCENDTSAIAFRIIKRNVRKYFQKYADFVKVIFLVEYETRMWWARRYVDCLLFLFVVINYEPSEVGTSYVQIG